MSEEIVEALGKLDAEDNGHWTGEGLPRLDVMNALVGSPVNREAVTAALRGFCRTNLTPEQPTDTPPEQGVQDAPPAPIEPPVAPTAPTAPTEASNDPMAEAELELTEARADTIAAAKRLKQANERMDALISKASTVSSHADHARTVKAFQASQAKQREAGVKKAAALEKLTKDI